MPITVEQYFETGELYVKRTASMYQDQGENVSDVRGRRSLTADGYWRERWKLSGGKGMLDHTPVYNYTEMPWLRFFEEDEYQPRL